MKSVKLPLIEKLFLISVLFNSGSALAQQTRIPTICMLLTFVGIIIHHKKICARFVKIYFCCALIGVALICQTNHFSGLENAIVTFQIITLATLTICYAFVTPSMNHKRIQFFVNLIFYFSIVGIVLFVLLLIGVPLPTVVTVEANNVKTVFYLCTYYTTGSGFIGYRNGCIFWEPGVYRIYLNLAIIICLYCSNVKNKPIKIIFLVIMIITTYSTTGLGLMFMIFTHYVLQYKKINKKMIFLIMLFMCACVLLLPMVYENILQKMSTLSYSYRVHDIQLGLELFKNKPFFGYGLNNEVYETYFMSLLGINRGNSNGIINVLVSIGGVGLIAYVYIVKKSSTFLYEVTGNNSFIIYLLFYFVSLLTEPIAFLPVIFMIFGFGLCSYKSVKEDYSDKEIA